MVKFWGDLELTGKSWIKTITLAFYKSSSSQVGADYFFQSQGPRRFSRKISFSTSRATSAIQPDIKKVLIWRAIAKAIYKLQLTSKQFSTYQLLVYKALIPMKTRIWSWQWHHHTGQKLVLVCWLLYYLADYLLPLMCHTCPIVSNLYLMMDLER